MPLKHNLVNSKMQFFLIFFAELKQFTAQGLE